MSKERIFTCDQCGKPVGKHLYGGKSDVNAVTNNARFTLLRHGGVDAICWECVKKIPKIVTDELIIKETK